MLLTDSPAKTLPAPSPWVWRWTHLIAPAGRVLDVACGAGRHVRWFAQRGFHVTGVDRADDLLNALRTQPWPVPVELLTADIEAEPWPLPGRQFDAVVVTRYLWRPLLPTLLQSVVPGGVLLYETFATGNEAYGQPARPDFLLHEGELLRVCAGWRIVAFEDGFLSASPSRIQRIAAMRPGPPVPAERFALDVHL